MYDFRVDAFESFPAPPAPITPGPTAIEAKYLAGLNADTPEARFTGFVARALVNHRRYTQGVMIAMQKPEPDTELADHYSNLAAATVASIHPTGVVYADEHGIDPAQSMARAYADLHEIWTNAERESNEPDSSFNGQVLLTF